MPTDIPSDSASKALTPEVTWAQRSSKEDASKNFIWLNILASDVAPKSMKLDVQPSHVTFSGFSDSKKANYSVQLDFYADVDPKESKIHHSARAVEMKLQKKDLAEEYWPRLLKESKKMHFLKTDFDKWADEDEQEGALDDDYMSQFGGAGGMPGADGGFGGLDFSKLGGGGGMPDLGAMGGMEGMGGMGGMGEDDEGDEDDEDLPELEDDENKSPAASSSKSGAKIQEVE